jgi:hypothetical protein
MQMLTTGAKLHEVQSAAWGPLRELGEWEREHGVTWQSTMERQKRSRELVRILSIPELAMVVERTAEGIRVVS